MTPYLSAILDAASLGRISIEEARIAVESWTAYQAGELRQKADVLHTLAELEISRMRESMRQRRE